MTSSKPRRPPALSVTVLLMNEAELQLRLPSFNPASSILDIEVDGSPSDPGPHRRSVPVRQVAYVAFHRAQDAALPKPSGPTRRMKVHTIGNKCFLVDVPLDHLDNRAGFPGIVPSERGVFERFFFYRHGVLVTEDAQAIGAMLEEQAGLDAEVIEQGLQEQRVGREKRLGQILVEGQRISQREVDRVVAEQVGSAGAMDTIVAQPDLPGRERSPWDMDIEDDEEPSSHNPPRERTDPALGSMRVPPEAFRTIDEVTESLGPRRVRLGEMLVQLGLLSEPDLERALVKQRKLRGRRLGEVLVEMGLIEEVTLITVLARKFAMPFVDLNDYEIDERARGLLTPAKMRKLQVVPLSVGPHSVTVAISDPLDLDVHNTLRFLLRTEVREVLVLPSQLQAALGSLPEPLPPPETTQPIEEEEEDLGQLAVQAVGDADSGEDQVAELLRDAEAAPVVRLVQQILAKGLSRGASDIHLLPRADGLSVAFRIDGDLIEQRLLDPRIMRQVVSRIKVVSGMDIAERRMPKDGRLMLRLRGEKYEMRVSSIPNIFGESLVLRVMGQQGSLPLEQLGIAREHIEALERVTRRPFGLVLVTGPTGSGKSTTLFSLLRTITDCGLHIVTIEDPVEAVIPGLNQIQVNAEIGLDFSLVLRNILRHDPDVIMVGEMRDKETASIGVEAALTGHLMFSTLHTNSAVDSIVRLTDMGVPSYLVAPSLLGILSQRLVKCLCPKCRTQIAPSRALERALERAEMRFRGPFFGPRGCDACSEGYKGRTLLYEYLEISKPVREAIHENITGDGLQKVAVQAGMKPRAQFALELAQRGVIAADTLLQELGV
jgi:type IV pilus assembly protein PilB